jgi:ABC-type ATPase with predicted acetyltransferase domain
MRELNEKLSIISRVVVHPKYRTIGLGLKLIKETLAKVGTPYVKMPAVMAKYNPFAEKAGMQKIAEQLPPKKEYAKAVATADLERLAHLIKVCGFLLQTKVYLFWSHVSIADEMP